MSYLVMLFGAATLAAGVVMVISPETIFNLIQKHSRSLGMHVLAVVVRLILGAALILCAADSKYPTVILILGWITVAAAIVMGIMGRRHFIRLIAWALGIPSVFRRFGGLLAVFFGCFLVYAVA
jgi:hypothetical protein